MQTILCSSAGRGRVRTNYGRANMTVLTRLALAFIRSLGFLHRARQTDCREHRTRRADPRDHHVVQIDPWTTLRQGIGSPLMVCPSPARPSFSMFCPSKRHECSHPRLSSPALVSAQPGLGDNFILPCLAYLAASPYGVRRA